MDRQELVALVADYAHRPDLAERIRDVFLPLAEARIGRDLKSQENETLQDVSIASFPWDLPDDYGSMRAFVLQAAAGPITLVSMDLHSINNYRLTGGSPTRYVIANRQIDVRPRLATDYTIIYFSKPALPADDSTNPVLDTWPQVYLYGTLIELNVWAQDAEQRDLALAAYGGEVGTINKDAERGRGEKPAMRRA